MTAELVSPHLDGVGVDSLDAAQTVIVNLRKALESRHSIGMAQGMLMLRYQLTERQAFDYLARRSQATQIKIRDLADTVMQELMAEGRAAADA